MIGDVGSNFYEEIDRIELPGGPGSNFGWPKLEGTLPIFCCPQCELASTPTDPVHTFAHLPGVTSIIAGPTVRRNPSVPASFPAEYEGDFFYFEFFSGVMRRLVPGGGGTWSIATPVLGQPDPENWGTGFFGVSDALMAPDGTIECVAFGIDGLSRGLYRILRYPGTGVPELGDAAAPGATIVAQPNPAGTGASVVLTLAGARGDRAWSGARLHIEDVRGRRVRELRAGSGSDDEARAVWDQRDDSGAPVAPGVYFVRAVREDGAAITGRVTILR
jgi:hypothetical protein